jgi:hypothetical protein
MMGQAPEDEEGEVADEADTDELECIMAGSSVRPGTKTATVRCTTRKKCLGKSLQTDWHDAVAMSKHEKRNCINGMQSATTGRAKVKANVHGEAASTLRMQRLCYPNGIMA